MLLYATSSASSQAALSLSEKGSIALSTTLTGLVVVFLTLLLLTFVISIFGKVVGGLSQKPKTKAPAPAPSPAPASVPTVELEPMAEEASYEDDDELIAVISAAVYAYGEASGKKYAVRAVRPSGRNNWSAAGLAENTRPF